MAHNLHTNSKTGKVSLYYALDRHGVPWHTLGQAADTAQDWPTARDMGGLNFQVGKVPMYLEDGTLISGWSAMLRLDTMDQLSVVPNTYEPLQTDDAASWTEALLEVGVSYESVGALGKGERFFLLARIPQSDFQVGDSGDKHEGFLLFASSHDRSMASTIKITDVRVICQNTMNLALDGKGAQLKVKHTKTAQDRLAMAQRLVMGTIQTQSSLAEKLNKLAQRKLTRASMTAILDKLFPVPVAADPAKVANTTRRDGVLNDILALYDYADNGAFPEQKGTAYALLNAVTDYTDHMRGTRSTDGRSADYSRAESAMFGSGSQLKDQALQVIYQLTDGTEQVRTIVPGASFANDSEGPALTGLLADIVGQA